MRNCLKNSGDAVLVIYFIVSWIISEHSGFLMLCLIPQFVPSMSSRLLTLKTTSCKRPKTYLLIWQR